MKQSKFLEHAMRIQKLGHVMRIQKLGHAMRIQKLKNLVMTKKFKGKKGSKVQRKISQQTDQVA